MERLPAELVHPILRSAAEDAVCTDRQWVVQLALVSRFVHELVSPILYHTMIVTRRNYLAIASLADLGDKCAHIFRAVRWLVADVRLAYLEEDRLAHLFPCVTSVDASRRLIELIASNPESCVRRLAVRYGSTFELPASTLASVTHITEYTPRMNSAIAVDYLAEQLGKLLQAMPALTHVALEVLSVAHHRESDSDVGAVVDLPQELAALENTLRATLQCPRIQAVAVRIAPPFLPHWTAIVGIMTQFKDARLSAWQDARRIDSWEKEAQRPAEDAIAGRTIWTEARHVWRPDV